MPALMAFTHKHILRGSNAAPLIYHVFNVEQDQVIRDSRSSRYSGSEWHRQTEKEKQKPVKVMNCLGGTHKFSLHASSFSTASPQAMINFSVASNFKRGNGLEMNNSREMAEFELKLDPPQWNFS